MILVCSIQFTVSVVRFLLLTETVNFLHHSGQTYSFNFSVQIERENIGHS